jgi:heptosyltransferase I
VEHDRVHKVPPRRSNPQGALTLAAGPGSFGRPGFDFPIQQSRTLTVPSLAGARIAVVMMSAIGDAVHTLPVINSLRAAAPDARITWIIQPGPHGLVAGHPAVDEFILFDRKRGWRAYADVRAAVRGRRFDLVIALQVYFKAGLVTKILRSPRKLGFDRARARDANWLFTTERIPARGQRHVQDQYFEFLEHLRVPPLLEWRLGPTAEEAARYAGALPPDPRPTVAFVVGTSKPAKEWPAERYAALADLLAERGMRTVLVGGRSPRELAAAETIARAAVHPPLDLLEWDLRKLVSVLDRVDVLVSPDTGPLHVGVALGTPTVSLIGYTNPKRVGPYRRFHDLMIDAYGDPGEDYPVSAEYRAGRMERITVDEVARRVELALQRYPRGR